jgi:drug/metabolite transporter (DMT)-like permease
MASKKKLPNEDLLWKGVLLAVIGLVVLIAPYRLQSPQLRDIVANSAGLGWLALALGAGCLVLWGWRGYKQWKRE